MQSPLREQLRLTDGWNAVQLDRNAARVFVPGSWANRRVLLLPGNGARWSTAALGEVPLQHDQATGGWQTEAGPLAGQWAAVMADGDLAEARLTVSAALHISSLDATQLSEGRLSIRIGLSAPSSLSDLLTLCFTLTRADGIRHGSLEVTVAPKARGLSLEMPIPHSLRGPNRLKVALCKGEAVLDNARITLVL